MDLFNEIDEMKLRIKLKYLFRVLMLHDDFNFEEYLKYLKDVHNDTEYNQYIKILLELRKNYIIKLE